MTEGTRRASGRGTAALAMMLAAGLAGCLEEQGAETAPQEHVFAQGPRFAAGQAAPADAAAANGQFAYVHDLSIAVAPRFVGAHFERAKSLCLQDASLRCVLLEATSDLNMGGPARPFAHVRLRLPRESVARVSQTVRSPVDGETASDLRLIRSATRLDDLARPIADAKRRLEQLEDYRGRLKNIEARAETRVEDLIKIANELSQTQSRIEEIGEQRRRLEERVTTELLDLSIRSDAAAGGPTTPIREVWRRAADIMGASAAQVLRFALMLVPWTPIIVAVLILLRWGARIWARRRER